MTGTDSGMTVQASMTFVSGSQLKEAAEARRYVIPAQAVNYLHSKWLWLLPALGSLVGTGSILVCYFLTARAGHLPPGVSTPPISFLGCEEPEHTAYQIGFALTGSLLASCVHIWSVVVYPMMLADGYKTCATVARLGGWAACIGVTGQGLITLEAGIVQKLQADGPPQLSQQSIVHQLIAAVFFAGAAAHCYAFTYAVNKSRPSSQLRSFVGPTGQLLKLGICLCTFVASPLAQMLHPAAQASSGSRLGAGFDVAGLAQYVTVGLYILYFGTYTIDLGYYLQGKQVSKMQ